MNYLKVFLLLLWFEALAATAAAAVGRKLISYSGSIYFSENGILISNYQRSKKKSLVCNFSDFEKTVGTFFLKRVINERHSLNWERRRSATPFFQKERCGSGTPFLRAGAGAERHSKNMGALNTLKICLVHQKWKLATIEINKCLL